MDLEDPPAILAYDEPVFLVVVVGLDGCLISGAGMQPLAPETVLGSGAVLE